MPKVIDKIGKYIGSLNKSHLCFDLLKAFYEDSKDLVVHSFSEKRQGYIDEYCNSNPFTFTVALDDLSKHNIVFYNSSADKLILCGLNSSFVRFVSFSPNSLKRKYRIKNMPLNYNSSVFSYNKGFRIPSSIFPYLTGKPLNDDEIKAILKSGDPERIYKEEQRRSLTKENIRVYCAFISLADKEGFIDCDNCHTIYISFLKQFGHASFNRQSWYSSVNKLISLNLISETATGYRVNMISEKHKDRFVIVPMVIFEKEFKQLEISSIRLFFEIIFALNNGESVRSGRIENLRENKAFFIKFSGSGADSEAQEKLKAVLVQIRRRYTGELIRSLIGKDDITALRKYFNFEVMPGSVFMIRIKKEYYISKDLDYNKDLIPIMLNCRKRTLILKQFFDDIGYTIENSDLIRIWRLLRNQSNYKLKKILGAIKEKAKHEFINISVLHLYVASLT